MLQIKTTTIERELFQIANMLILNEVLAECPG